MRALRSFLLLLILTSAPCVARAEEEAAALADTEEDAIDAPPHSFGATYDDDGDDDDDWDRIFAEQRRLDADGEVAASFASSDGVELVPGLPGVDLTVFDAALADKAVLERVIDWAYDTVAHRSAYKDTFVHAEDLYDLVVKTLNPLEDPLEDEDYDALRAALQELRVAQGLLDDAMVVYRGFISRGAPLRFLQALAQHMHSTSATTAGTRRLEEEEL